MDASVAHVWGKKQFEWRQALLVQRAEENIRSILSAAAPHPATHRPKVEKVENIPPSSDTEFGYGYVKITLEPSSMKLLQQTLQSLTRKIVLREADESGLKFYGTLEQLAGLSPLELSPVQR